MDDKDYYRASVEPLDRSPHTEAGRANLRAENDAIIADREAKDLLKPLHERGMKPTNLWECAQEVEKMRDMFRYDPETGLLYRRYVSPMHNDYLATKGRGPENQRRVSFYRLTTTSARVVWLLHHGKWPDSALRRRDDDVTNDRIENLYESGAPDVAVIPFQGKRTRANQSRGVARCGPDHWQAYYRRNGKQFGLGKFKTEAEAIAARQGWESGHDLV